MNLEKLNVSEVLHKYQQSLMELEKADRIAHQSLSETLEKGKRGRGRPRKADEDKVRHITMKLPPHYVEYLKERKTARGLGGEVRRMIDENIIREKREKEQIRLLKDSLNKLNQVFNNCSKFYQKDSQGESEKWLKELHLIGHQVKVLIKILSFELKDLKKLVSPQDFRNIELTLSMKD